MLFLDKWERKFGWLSFPGLLRYYALLNVAVYLLQYINPALGAELDFDLEKIMEGEIWRAVTFLFSTSGLIGQGGFSILAIYCLVMIAFMASDGLEEAWGPFRTSMFHYTGIACILLLNVVFSLLIGMSIPATGLIIHASAFFAFATLFPRVELFLFFVLPVQVRWIALAGAAWICLSIIRTPFSIIFYLPFFANYLLWAGIPALRGQARVVNSVARKRKFNKSKLDDGQAFHRCKSCGRTEVSDPELEFRMAADGEEYCADHLEP